MDATLARHAARVARRQEVLALRHKANRAMAERHRDTPDRMDRFATSRAASFVDDVVPYSLSVGRIRIVDGPEKFKKAPPTSITPTLSGAGIPEMHTKFLDYIEQGFPMGERTKVARRFLIVDEAALLLGMDSPAVIAEIVSGELPAYKPGIQVYRVPLPEFIAYARRHGFTDAQVTKIKERILEFIQTPYVTATHRGSATGV